MGLAGRTVLTPVSWWGVGGGNARSGREAGSRLRVFGESELSQVRATPVGSGTVLTSPGHAVWLVVGGGKARLCREADH